MSGLIGNKNALGNKGGGRKSAYQEKADAETLHKMFFDVLSKEDIKQYIKEGNYSLMDVFISKGFGGNDKILIELFKKIFPDNINLSGLTDPLRQLTDEQIDDRIKQLKIAVDGVTSGEDKEESKD